jgi:DNA topoisomerase I
MAVAKKAKKSRAGGTGTLVIVESPAKAKTIEKYLGKGYTVKASMGHLIDLPKSRLAIDVGSDFEPEYITVRGKAKLLKELQTEAGKSAAVMLASDNDREGEAISFHLKNALVAKHKSLVVSRIVFNEITPQAIREAVRHPGDIDMNKVQAQKARRVLDRIVGYYLSPLLWKKVKNGLSAGRVQSVALRLICDREKEVESFIPEEYWTVEADLTKGRAVIESQLVLYKGEKPVLQREPEVLALIATLAGKQASVVDKKEMEKSIKPRPPFTTSKLQQAAANRLGFTSKKTMQIAQQLYEGVNIGSTRIGLITYMRTDSVRISQGALEEVRTFITANYPDCLPPEAISYAVQKNAQDAHEAIRPTVVTYTPEAVKNSLTRDQLRLYTIIWERFVSSQMTNARTLTTSVDIGIGDAVFRVSGTRTVEKGFYKAISLLQSKEEKDVSLPVLAMGEAVDLSGFRPEQHFTQGPARYTDATIVKMLEEKGIGRPSTYAPIISVLLERFYVVRSNKQLQPTQLGRIISDMLVSSFPDVVDVGFTAGMEKRLDEVEERNDDWVGMIRDFYGPFNQKVEEVMKSIESVKGVLDEKTSHVCEKCGRPMVKRLGRFGFFLACTGFPECRNTRSIPLAKCPMPGCTGEIVARRKLNGRGKEFYGCTNYPECQFITHFKPISSTCPKCGRFMVEKFDKKRGSFKACINPDCDYLHTQDDGDAQVD